MSLLRVRDLKVNYGGIEALKGISFDVDGQAVMDITKYTLFAEE